MRYATLEGLEIVPIKKIWRKGEEITYLTPEDHTTVVNLWLDYRINIPGLFISREPPGFLTSEGDTGECYVEEWYCESYALRWLYDTSYPSVEYLHELDRRCAERRGVLV